MFSYASCALSLGQSQPNSVVLIVMLALAVLVVGLLSLSLMMYFSLWLQALLSSAPISFFALLGMRLQRVDPRLIVRAYIRVRKAGLEQVGVEMLEQHHLAGGNVAKFVTALIEAHRHEFAVQPQAVAAVDLAGYDPQAAIRLALEHHLSPSELTPVFLQRIGQPRDR